MQDLIVPLLIFSSAMSLTPGPNVILVTATAANFGFVRTLPQIAGITLGFGALVAATAFGLASIFEAEPRIHLALKYVGAAYLLYLAWRIARADTAQGEAEEREPIGALQSALLQCLNPKGWILTVGALATFTTTGDNVVWQTALVGTIITAAVFGSVVIWAAFGAAISRWIHGPKARRAFNWIMAGLLVLSLVPVFW